MMQNSVNLSLVIASLALAGLLTPADSQANIVLNGGFETGNFSEWTVNRAGYASDLNIWSGVKHSGSYSTRFNGNMDESISQTLATESGSTYDLSFWINSGVGTMQVFWDGIRVYDAGWWTTPTFTKISVTLTGSGSDVLTFQSMTNNYNAGANPAVGMYLDDISLLLQGSSDPSSVPEPSTLLMVLGGLAGLAGSIRRNLMRA